MRLGDEQKTVRALQHGDIQMSVLATNNFMPFAPSCGWLNMPYLFGSLEEFRKLVDLMWDQHNAWAVKESGARVLAIVDIGYRQLTTDAAHPVRNLADVRGLAVRTPQNALAVSAFNALGFKPHPASFADTYGMLAKGTVNGQEGCFNNVVTMKFADHQKYATCINYAVQMKLPYGTDAFDFIGTSVSQPVVLMTAKNAPWKNINEFIEMAKKNPNKYVVGITATGNMTHVPMLQFAEHFGLKLRFIPYRSGGEIFKDIMAGRTHLHADAPASLSTFDVYGLVQFADERSENLSDIPTTKELGMDARFSHWQGVIAPRGLPKDVLRTLETAISEVVNSEAFQQEALRLKTKAHWMSSEAFRKLYDEELNTYGEILKHSLPQK